MSRAHTELAEQTENDLKRLRDQGDKIELKLEKEEGEKKRRRRLPSFSSSSSEEEEEEEEDTDEETIGSSSTLSSSDSEEDQEQARERMELARKQDDFMDEWFDCEIPASFDEEVDIFMVTTAETLAEDALVVPERYKSFQRDLYAYDTEVTVIKKYAPWGNAEALRSEGFVVKKKVYSPSGEIQFVLLKNLYGAKQTVLVGPDLFAGWVDEYAANFL